MCVIFWANKERPSQYMIEKAFDHNGDGGGLAWRTVNEQNGPVVEWKKGLKVEEMVELCATLPIPFVAHFRIASIGGVRPSLTHPFPINKNGSLALAGRTKGQVLFHNGHWKDWDSDIMRTAVLSNTPIPVGKWSDTRAMAWYCAIYGPGFMEFLNGQKGVIFGPTDAETHIFDGNGWTKINDVWCSNDFFMKGQTVSGQQMMANVTQNYPHTQQVHSHPVQQPGRGAGNVRTFCKYGTGRNACTNQTLDTDGYCFVHPKGVPRLQHLGQVDRVAQGMATVMGPTEGATGGSRVPPSPFVQKAQQQTARLPLDLAPGEVISIETAEYLWKEKIISHNLLKKIRHHWERATGPGKKASRRAELALRQISISITQMKHLNGSAH